MIKKLTIVFLFFALLLASTTLAQQRVYRNSGKSAPQKTQQQKTKKNSNNSSFVGTKSLECRSGTPVTITVNNNSSWQVKVGGKIMGGGSGGYPAALKQAKRMCN